MNDLSNPWNLLSRHGQIIVSVALRPDVRLIQLADHLGVTERSVRQLLSALKQSRAVAVTRQGRTNRYAVDFDYRLTHPIETRLSLRRVVALFDGHPGDEPI